MYDFTVRKITNDLVLGLINRVGERDSSAPYNLIQTYVRDLRNKKVRMLFLKLLSPADNPLQALIMRFGTGTDEGIFKVQEMLIKHLGFASADLELLYFDVDPPTGPKMCTLGQDPPTARNFKFKFTQLCQSAVPGYVRFLYVDAHSTIYSDEDNSGEEDDQDEG